MSTAPKNRILIFIIGILLITNIILIATLVFKTSPKKGMREDRFSMITSFLQNEINFSKDQLQKYDSINTQHRLQMKNLFDGIKKDREEQFRALSAQHFSDSAINVTAHLAAGNQINIELLKLEHFKQIRNLCTAEQLPKFDSLFYKAFKNKKEEIKK